MVTGIGVEVSGQELRDALERRVEARRRRANRWDEEANRSLELLSRLLSAAAGQTARLLNVTAVPAVRREGRLAELTACCE